MKNKMRILLLAGVFLTLNATAQSRTTPEVCYKRCATMPLEDPEAFNDTFKAKLMKIQAKKKEETDPEKIKGLEEAEKNEIERLKESLERTCSKLCKYDN